MGVTSQGGGAERERSDVLDQYHILDTEPERSFDEIVRLAAHACAAPMAAINFVDARRHWFKAALGIEPTSVTRDGTFYDHTLRSADLLEVEDAAADPLFQAHPDVTGGPRIRFYAGVPLSSEGGQAVGTLCVFDTEPRSLTDAQAEALRMLARQVLVLLEQRRNLVELHRMIVGRRTAEQALRESEERLRHALEAAHAGTWDWDLVNDRQTWSPAVYRLLGLEPGAVEPSYESWLAAVHPEDRGRAAASAARREPGEDFSIEYRVVVSGGAVRWVVARGRVLYDESGRPLRMVGIMVDITDRVRAEAEARAAAEYEKLFLLASDSILILSPDGLIVDANEKACALYGVTRDECVARPVGDFSREPARDRALIERAFRAGSADGTEVTHAGQGGSDVRLMVSASAIEYRGEPAVIAIYRDVTQRVRALEALRESESKLRAVFENASDGIIIFDQSGLILEINPRVCEMLGCEARAIQGRAIREYLYADDVAQNPLRLRDLLDGETVVTERPLRGAGGSRLVVEISAKLIEEGRILALVRDVTERKRAEEMLRQGERQLALARRLDSVGTLAGGVAHDFNNALQAIRGFSELSLQRLGVLLDLAAGDTLPEEAAEALRREARTLRANVNEVMRAAGGAKTLTHQLLAFSRQQPLEPTVVNLNDKVSGLMRMLTKIVREDIRIDFKPDPSLSPVLIDTAQVEGVLMNLAANAQDAMPEGGELVIETHNMRLDEDYLRSHEYARAGSYVLMMVSDNGTGIPEEIRARVFDPFFTTKEVGKGTGLGLAMAYGVMKQLGGFIEVYSETGEELHGTTFKLYFPVAAAADAAGPAAFAPTGPAELVGGIETILVAEDRADLRLLMQRVLEDLGYTVLLAADGAEAVEVFRQRRREIGLVVLDVVMPNMSGRAAFERIREMEPDVPAIFLTGYSAEMSQIKVFSDMGVVVLQKPFENAVLGLRVREVLDSAYAHGAAG